MQTLAIVLCTFISSIVYASIETRLSNGQLAYYGSDFYKNFPASITKENLFRILDSEHSVNQNSYDSIGYCQGTCFKHMPVGYNNARVILFGELHNKKDSNGQFVEDVYCQKKFYFREVDDVSHMGNEVNIEHTWPQSKFSSRFGKDLQKSDLHHLFPTDSSANSRRGNYNFGNVSESEDELDVNQCNSSRLGHHEGDMIFTPPTQHKGNVARAIFYFAVRYQMDIPPSEERALREWHKNDPVDEQERIRHELISKHQFVRNPFIDFPELADKISNL